MDRGRGSTEHALEHAAGGPVAAHAVNTAAGRRRGRANEDVSGGRRIRIDACDRPEEQLRQVGCASADVTADVIRVVSFEVERVDGGSTDHDIPETWRCALDLRFDERSDVDVRPVWHVTI